MAYGIKNYTQYYNYYTLPTHPDYYTNNIIIIHQELMLSKRLKFSKHSQDFYGVNLSKLHEFRNMQQIYSYFSIDNEIELHKTLVYGMAIENNYMLSNGVWYGKHNGRWYVFDAELVGFVLDRVKRKERARVRFFIDVIRGVPVLILFLDTRIVGLMAALSEERKSARKIFY